MKKIKALFVIDRTVNMATREVEPSSEWVIRGEGVATIKYDGTPALIKDGILYMRWNRKLKKPFRLQWQTDKESFKPRIDMFVDVPAGAIQLEEAPAPISLHFPYWIPVTQEKCDRPFMDAFNKLDVALDGTYELIGRGIQGNIYKLDGHELVRHGAEVIKVRDYSFDAIREMFGHLNAEGIVWHHKEDGRMVKLRRSHFNFDWRVDPRDNQESRKQFNP